MSFRESRPPVSRDRDLSDSIFAVTRPGQSLHESSGFANRPLNNYDPFAGRSAEPSSISRHDQRQMGGVGNEPAHLPPNLTTMELSSSVLTLSNPSRGFPDAYAAASAHGSIAVTPYGFDHVSERRRSSQESYYPETDSPSRHSFTDYDYETSTSRASDTNKIPPRYHTQRRPYNQDEFDGPAQILAAPSSHSIAGRERILPELPVHLKLQEQEDIMSRVNNILSQSAFHFVAKYEFPIPVERDKPQVRVPADREWTEWAYLLKRLATKRRIPARVLYGQQIKQFVTTLENSLGVRRSTAPRISDQSSNGNGGVLKDDRNILQLISAGTQVAKILKDAVAMEQMDSLYIHTEKVIQERRIVSAPGMHFYS